MSLVETLAEKALTAEEASDHFEEWRGVALDIVRRSPLSGWFPVSWQVVDHNLPMGRSRDQVLVAVAPESAETEPDMVFIVTMFGTPADQRFEVRCAAAGTSLHSDDSTIVRTAADVGRWLRAWRNR